MRNKIVAGNWKMNLVKTEASSLFYNISTFLETINLSQLQKVIIAPPTIHLDSLSKIKSKILLAAQNCHFAQNGAYTGETSAAMLYSYNINYCIVGHSERRQYFAESNTMIKDKIDLLLSNNISPIFCCGESLENRNKGDYKNFIELQVLESLCHLDEESIRKIIIAYEPIWAIGTGITATSDQAQEVHSHIRKFLAQKYDKAIAENISILYGGSCNAKNAEELFKCPDIDGGLIGGAALKADEFCSIINILHG